MSAIIKEVSVWHPETIKETIHLCSWQAARHRALWPSNLQRTRVGRVCVCVFAHVCVHSRSRKASWYEKCDSSGNCCHVVSHWESMNYPQSFQHSSSTAGSIKLFMETNSKFIVSGSKWGMGAFSDTARMLELKVNAQCEFRANISTVIRQFLFSADWTLVII